MSQPVDNVLKGCNVDLDMHYPEGNSLCGNKCYGCKEIHFCSSCKSKAQGMIEILKLELRLLKKINSSMSISYYNAMNSDLRDAIEEIQADLDKLRTVVK